MNGKLPTHLGIYREAVRYSAERGLSEEWQKFQIVAGTPETLAESLNGKPRAYLLKIPRRFARGIANAARFNLGTLGRTRVGSIGYQLSTGGTLAVTHEYNPKEGVGLVGQRDFAPMIEFFCAKYLADKHGVTHFGTSNSANQNRIAQLERLGLKPFTVYERELWLRALRKGWRGK